MNEYERIPYREDSNKGKSNAWAIPCKECDGLGERENYYTQKTETCQKCHGSGRAGGFD